MLTNSRYNHTSPLPVACQLEREKAIFAAKQYIDATFDYHERVGMFRYSVICFDAFCFNSYWRIFSHTYQNVNVVPYGKWKNFTL